jgi:hypothetical protein
MRMRATLLLGLAVVILGMGFPPTTTAYYSSDPWAYGETNSVSQQQSRFTFFGLPGSGSRRPTPTTGNSRNYQNDPSFTYFFGLPGKGRSLGSAEPKLKQGSPQASLRSLPRPDQTPVFRSGSAVTNSDACPSGYIPHPYHKKCVLRIRTRTLYKR